jgi:hypothetical protein
MELKDMLAIRKQTASQALSTTYPSAFLRLLLARLTRQAAYWAV